MLIHKHIPTIAQRGFALIEALVSLLIISFGLLGMAGLQARLTTLEIESYQRSQALILAKDIAARLTNNAKAASAYAVSAANSSTDFVGGTGGVTLGACVAAPTTTENSATQSVRLAACDLQYWKSELLGAAEGGTSALSEPRGCIESTGTANEYRVSVTWRGMAATAAPTVNCASSMYTTADQPLRRAINLVVRVPDLDCNSTKATGC